MTVPKNDDNKLPTPGLDARNALVAAAMSVGAGTAAGGSPMVAVAAGGATLATNFVIGLQQRWAAQRVGSAAWAYEQAAEIVGGLDVLNDRASSTDERLELTAKVLEASAQTSMPNKIRALAQVLADGVTDGGDVNEATVLALALKDLEGSHVEVLRVMATTRPIEAGPPGERRRSSEDWQLGEIRDLSGVRVFEAILAVLVRHGLVTDFHDRSTWATIEAARWNLTPVGHRCLGLLGLEEPTAVTAD
ncbi:hypothetical protein [Actinomycetospora atypica]|uniref:Uncharacterized protein n=1 Tax=Actinomycetospora atypica TaxID=1290095 RepID=A0ABV9YFI1_9PSEU